MNSQEYARFFRAFFESSNLGHGLVDLSGTIMYLNPALCRMIGEKTAEEVVGKNISSYHPPETEKRFLDEIFPKVKKEGSWIGELFLRSVRGDNIYTTYDISLIKDEQGNPAYFGVIIEDITEWKKAEETLRLTQFSVDHSSLNIYWVNHEGRFVYVNDHALQSLGYTRDEMLSMCIWDIDPVVTNDFWLAHWEELRTTKIAKIESLQMRKDGSSFPVEVQANYVAHAGEEYSFAFVRDITESKEAKRELEKEKELAEKYLDIVKVIIVGLNNKKEVTLVNKRGCEVLGYDESEIMGKNWFDHFLPKRYRKEVNAVADELLQGKIEPMEYHENPVETKSGEERVIAWHNIALKNEQGEIEGLLSSGEDITERKEAERRILQERDFSDAVLNSLPGVFYMFDRKGKFLRWNKNFETVSEYSHDEIRAMSPLDFFVGNDKAKLKAKIRDVFLKGYSEVEAEFVAKSGKRTIYFFNGQIIEIEGKNCLIGTGINIAQRKKFEEDLKRTLHEKETLLNEVHHRVKNNLLTLYSLINLQKISLRGNEGVERALEDAKQRISAMGKVHQMLYLSESFSEVNFAEYIRSLIDEVKITYGISGHRIKVVSSLEPVILNMDTAIPCGLIINELLINAFRHAFPGEREGCISVSLAKKGENVELKVQDDGVGMGGDPFAGKGKSLGLRLVSMLSQQLNGKNRYDGRQGSLFTIVFKNVRITKK